MKLIQLVFQGFLKVLASSGSDRVALYFCNQLDTQNNDKCLPGEEGVVILSRPSTDVHVRWLQDLQEVVPGNCFSVEEFEWMASSSGTTFIEEMA